MKKIVYLFLALFVIAACIKGCSYLGEKSAELNAPSKMYFVYGKLNQLDPHAVKGEIKNLGPDWKTLTNDEYKKLLVDLNVHDDESGRSDQLYYDLWKRPYIVSLRINGKQELEWTLSSLGPSGVPGSADNYRIENFKINHE